MIEYKHSVSLDVSKCKGCTHCLQRCPTEAIRVRGGKAAINSQKCIDCGECIRVCPYNAKKATHDSLDCLNKFKYKIALPAPALYGQFDNLDDIDFVIQGLLDMGFDDVFEVAKAAELVSGYTRQYLKREGLQKPVISSACPVVVRLIRMRFPFLCDNIMPILPPVEVAGKLAREKALKEHPELLPEDIGCIFISPCPAKVSYVKNSFSGEKSNIDNVVSVSDVYFRLIDLMKKTKEPTVGTEAGNVGVSWAISGGECTAVFNEKYLAADGIENVIRVLDQIENSDFPDLEFVELNACNGGCVGGVMSVANPYIARARIQSLRRYLPVSPNLRPSDEDVPEDVMLPGFEYIPTAPLSEDRKEARMMMSEIQEIRKDLPDLDCGSCGAPTCAAFAEDIIRGEICADECVVFMREAFHSYLKAHGDASKITKESEEPEDDKS
ncbi:MAG: 4Fe-4S dicluster domain-containing protein [Clostridia bacterium]|nr:4Fe-4S dicluster domain-containing protein [Clostridia bacterium]